MALELRGTYYPGCTVINSTDNLPNLWHTSIKAAIVDHEDGSRAAEMEVERLGGYSTELWLSNVVLNSTQKSYVVQGDHSACSKSPVEIDMKAVF